jgi:hypothetical protein
MLSAGFKENLQIKLASSTRLLLHLLKFVLQFFVFNPRYRQSPR